MNARQKARFRRFGDWELDVHRQILRSSSDARAPVTLTPRVFDTLLCLLDHAGELVEKDTLIKTVWPRAVVEDNNLDQHISTLRQLLGERRGENRYIVTVRGRGYRFVAPVAEADEPGGAAPTTKPEPADPPNATAAPRHARKRARMLRATLASAGLALAAAVVLLAFRSPTAPPAPVEAATLAVLPFKPLAAADRNESLELGMAETLIVALNTRRLRVSPLSSVRRYAGLEQDAVAAGRALGVRAVLEGHIQRDGTRLRVSARLLNVEDGRQLWAERYDEEWNGIFAVQDAIADKVRAAMATGAFADDDPLPAPLPRRTRDAEAYQLYVTGQFQRYRLSESGLRQAIAYFERALARDPEFALAYVGLADAYSVLGVFGIDAPHATFPHAQAAVERALEIDPLLGEAYASLGHIKVQYEHDWDGGERALRRSIELNPYYAFPRQLLGIYLGFTGRFDEGIESMRQAQALEPLAPGFSALIGMLQYYARRYDEAAEQLRQTLEMDPRFPTTHTYLAATYLRLGRYDEAMRHLEQVESLTPGVAGYVGQVHALSGRREAALEEIERLVVLSRERYVPAYDIATIHGALGDADGAILWLERAFEDRSTLIAWLPWEPAFDGIRSDPRYASLVRRLASPR